MPKLYHHVVDCSTGEVTRVPLTPEEMAERNSLAVDPAILPPAPDPFEAIAALRAEIEALKAKG